MNSKTTVWLWRPTATDPSAKLGFYQCLKATAQTLVDTGFAQWPRIGAYRFNKRDKAATNIQLGMRLAQASVPEGGVARFTVTLSEGISEDVVVSLFRDASSTAVSGTNYTPFPVTITFSENQTEYHVDVQTIDTAAAGDTTLRINAAVSNGAISGNPNATLTITDVT